MKKLNLDSLKSLGGVKSIKRTLHRSRTKKLRKLVALMAICGVISSSLYLTKYVYLEYAVSRADIVLSYPEISQSRNPDGSRFTYHDFICDENLEAALKLMQKDGKYKTYTVDDIREDLYLYTYLDESAGDSVSTKRSEGNDFSYVANEFKITFAQPHDYKNPNFFKKIFTPDYSKDFLKALIAVNRKKLAEEHGGISGFKALLDIDCGDTYDYSEKLKIYRVRMKSIMSYIDFLNSKDSTFVSKKYNMTLKDLKEEYQFLIYDKLDGIANFIETSGLSKDTETAINKLLVNIEDVTLKHDKNVSAAYVNNYAMRYYDHTFTENLINVVRNDTYGLYQARPKTAFDTVVDQKHIAEENVAEYSAQLRQLEKELNKHNEIVSDTAEYEALIKKCETLVSDFENKYASLGTISDEVVSEYLNSVNENYITASVSSKGIISKKLAVKAAIAFMLGAALAFILFVVKGMISDSKKFKAKKKLIARIKENEGGAE